MKWILLLSTLLFSLGLRADEQYTEGACILLQHQINDFSVNKQSSQYRTSQSAYDKHCRNPRTVAPLNTGLQRSATKPRAGEVLKISRQSAGPAKMTIYPSIPAKETARPELGFNRVFSTIMPSVLWPVFAIFLLLIVIASLRINSGSIGEWLVNRRLALFTKGGNATLYKNMLFRAENGELTEVDHLLINPFGIFVIESKNYSGWIFGGEKQAKWTQQIYRNKSQFMNPLRQNYKHCLAVQAYLGVKEGIESLVVFHDKATFKTRMPNNVVMLSGMNRYIKRFTDEKFSNAQLKQLNALLSLRAEGTTKEDYKEHVRQVKARRVGLE